MISVGIDVSKGKSMVCMLKPYGEIIASPYEVEHTGTRVEELCRRILSLGEGVTYFISGCAQGTDTIAAEIILKLKNGPYLMRNRRLNGQ